MLPPSILYSRMLDVKCNFRGRYKHSNTLCPVCMTAEDSQAHILACRELDDGNQLVTGLPSGTSCFIFHVSNDFQEINVVPLKNLCNLSYFEFDKINTITRSDQGKRERVK